MRYELRTTVRVSDEWLSVCAICLHTGLNPKGHQAAYALPNLFAAHDNEEPRYKEFAKYNQLYPDQFLPLQRDMIGKFGAAKDQWFSSFLLQVENHSSWHRLFVDPLSRAMYSSDGPDFEFVQQKRKEGLSIHEAVWQLAWKKSGPEMASLEAWLEEHEKYRSVA